MTTRYSNVGDQERELTNKRVDVFSDREQQTREVTQAGVENVENLRRSTIDSRIYNAGVKSNLTEIQTGLEYERDLHTLVGFLSAIDKLLEEIDDIKDGISKKGQTKEGKEKIKNVKKELNEYKRQLKIKKKALLKQKNVEIYNEDISNFKYLKKQVEGVKKFLYTNIQRGNGGNLPETKNTNKYQSKADEFEENKKNNEGNYTQGEYDIYTTNAGISNPNIKRCKITPINPSGIGSETIQQTTKERTPTDYSNLDRGEAFQKGGLAGLLDKGLSSCSNMTPGQKNTWKSVGVLGAYAVSIFGLYRFFTSEKRKRRQNALIAGGTIFGTQAITGENPISLFNKLITGGFSKEWLNDRFGNLFGDAVNGISNAGTESSDTVSPAMYSLMIFNSGTTAGDIHSMTDKFKSDPNSWKEFRLEAENKLRDKYGEKSTETFSTIFSDDFDEEKRKNWLASFGITDSTNNSKLIYEYANNASMNSLILQKFIDENGLKITDNKTKKEQYEQYIKSLKDKNQAIDISVLENHKDDRFTLDNDATFTERPEDIQNKEKLKNQVNNLTLDEQTKTELKRELLLFYDERSIKNKPNLNDFSLEMDDNLLILKSHQGEKTKINLQNKTLTRFGSSDTNKYEIKFVRIKDLLNVADLTNNILSMYRGKVIASTPPFQYKPERKGICFNDAEPLSFNFDTRVLSTGRGGATRKIDTLGDHPEQYAQYLSDRWIENLTQTQETQETPKQKPQQKQQKQQTQQQQQSQQKTQ